MIRLSPSQINMFLRCPRQWAFRYIENRKVPPSGAMKQSGVWHQVVEANYSQKIESATDLPLDEMTDRYAQTFEDEFQKEEVILDEGQTKGALKDEGVEITKEHHKIIAPTVQPAQVEQWMEFDVKGDNETEYKLVGRIDLVDKDHFIRDNKAMGKTRNQNDLDKDVQLSSYSLMYRLQNKEAEAGLRLDAVIKKKKPEAVVLKTERNREGLRLHLNNIAHVARAIEAEAFPMHTDGWHCSPKFCGYWSLCQGKGITTTVDMGASNE